MVFLPSLLWAGGSGLNVVVVANSASSNSLALANYYCERRQIPPQNVLRINWTGSSINWSGDQFRSLLALPLQAMLVSRSLAAQVDYVALSMDIPYRVATGGGDNSTTTALFYGFKTNGAGSGCVLASTSTNDYAFSETFFRDLMPGTNGSSFLTTMLTAPRLDQARRFVDQGVKSDFTSPTQTVLLEKTTDSARNVRFYSFDNAIFDARVNGRMQMVRTNSNQTAGWNDLFGVETGLATLTLSSNTFVPGALADSLTSYAGYILEANSQTNLLAFLLAGAAGSYGTITEPCNYRAKFPDPLCYFYQARGFTLAESYYQSVLSPYQGLIVGEPLAAPFARLGSGAWVGAESNLILSGTAPLALSFQAAVAVFPLQRVDLFLDGVWLRTLTNIAPAVGDVLTVKINGQTQTYTVPANATVATVTDGLATALNDRRFAPRAQILAIAYGDRLELESTNLTLAGSAVPITVSTTSGGAGRPTTFLSLGSPQFLDSVARGWQGVLIKGPSQAGDYLQLAVTKTNGVAVTVASTNTSGTTNVGQLGAQFLSAINATTTLQGSDGLVADDASANGTTNYQFLLYARGAGLAASRLQTRLTVSSGLTVAPTGLNSLDDNLTDLRPRNHLYVTAGVTNLALSFVLDTTSLPDGAHELTAVAYEGSHVRTQCRVSQQVQVQNTLLTAILSNSAPTGFCALADSLQFTVVANTDTVARIELLSNGGTRGVVSNQAAATFSFPAASLGLGLLPFYALVTGADGARYRTETQWIRVMDNPPQPFEIQITAPPVLLVWPTMEGLRYDVWGGNEPQNPFPWRASLLASNSGTLQWTDPDTNASQRFYRVTTSP